MLKRTLTTAAAAAFVLAASGLAGAQSTMGTAPASPAGAMASATPGAMSSGMSGDSMSGHSMSGHSMGTMSASMEHGFPTGTAGPDGTAYTGAPDLQTAISLVTAGGPVGHFSLVKALTAMAGAKTANAEVAKLTKQYGAASVTSFVTVQNFAVNDAVAKATAAGVKFPKPMYTGATLAKHAVMAGLLDGTYYEGVQLDRLVTHAIHEEVMTDIDQKYGEKADANYHRVADQAHYDLAHALGVTSVKLAAYH